MREKLLDFLKERSIYWENGADQTELWFGSPDHKWGCTSVVYVPREQVIEVYNSSCIFKFYEDLSLACLLAYTFRRESLD